MYADWALSPDGALVAFAAAPPEAQGAGMQMYVMRPDGAALRKLTDGSPNARWPHFAPDGRLAFVVHHQRNGKQIPMDLVVHDPRKPGAAPAVLVEKTPLSDISWSPDGGTICYGVAGTVVFHDVATGKRNEVALKDINPEMDHFAAVSFAWAPDSRAVACRLFFWGGRMANGPKMFGDEELFIIPRDGGRVTWFSLKEEYARPVEWMREPAAK